MPALKRRQVSRIPSVGLNRLARKRSEHFCNANVSRVSVTRTELLGRSGSPAADLDIIVNRIVAGGPRRNKVSH